MSLVEKFHGCDLRPRLKETILEIAPGKGHMKARLAVASTIGVALTLAACSPPNATDAASPVPSATVTVTVTASPTAVAPAPTASAPNFDFTSYEGAQIGSTWAHMGTQIGLAVAGNYQCAWYGQLRATELVWTYAFTDASSPGGAGSTFFYTQLSGESASGPFPRNAEGIGVGSTKTEVLAAYPNATVGTFDNLTVGNLTTITVPDPTASSKDVFAISGNSPAPDMVDLLQWGSSDAGTQWGHLCTGL